MVALGLLVVIFMLLADTHTVTDTNTDTDTVTDTNTDTNTETKKIQIEKKSVWC